MNTLLHWLTAPEWALVVKALLHSLWQGALFAAGLALLLRSVHTPTLRYRLTLAGLGAVVASAVITWAVLNAPKAAPAEFVAPPPQTIAPMPAPTGPVQKIVVVAERKPVHPQMQWTAWLALAWLIGASAMLGRASVKVAGAEQLRRSCRPLEDDRIAALVAETRNAVKLTRQIRVAVTDHLTSPAVVGVLVPTLILPLTLITTLTPEQIRFVLLHELAHIRRGDYLANLFQLFAEALLFFNPAVWWLSYQIRLEREACCDALAIELSGAPADYARTLVSVAETMLNPSPAAAPAFGDGREPSSLTDRVQRALVPGYRPSLRLTWRAMLGALVMGGVLLGVLATGTRETVAATAKLLAAGQIQGPSSPATNSTHLLTRGVGERGQAAKTETTDRKDHPELHAAFSKLSIQEIERLPFMDAYRYWLQELRNFKKNADRNGNYSIDSGGITDPATRKFTPFPFAALQCRLGQLAPLHEDFLFEELAVNADVHKVLESSPQLCEKYAVHSMTMVSFVPGRGYVSKPNSGYSPQVQQALWLKARKAIANAPPTADAINDLPIINPATGMSEGAAPGVNPATGLLESNATNLVTRIFKVTTLELARAVNDAGPVPATNTQEQLSRFYALAGLDPQLPGRVRFFSEGGGLYLRGTEDELAKVERLLTKKPTSTPVASSAEPKADATPITDSQPTATNEPALHTRIFRLDSNRLTQSLQDSGQMKGTNFNATLREFFKTLGVELNLPKAMFFNDRNGMLLVRASLADLDTIEQALQVINTTAPQVNIQARFVELPAEQTDWLDIVKMTTNGTHAITGILTDPQFRVLLRTLEQAEGVEVLTAPDVTTISGRPAQIQMVDIRTIVTGAVPLVTNGVTTNILKTSPLPFGPMLDVIPFVGSDGYTVQMTILPTVTEFLGYDDPGAFVTGNRRGTNALINPLPLPRFRVRQVPSTPVNVWDGQTVVVGGFVSENVTLKPDGTESRKAAPQLDKKRLFVFITPTIIDQAGNRMNATPDASTAPPGGVFPGQPPARAK